MDVKHYTEGPNNYRIEIGTLTMWFSYETCIAFQVGGRRTVCENVWSKTTGKHLGRIDGGSREAKAARIKYSAFAQALGRLSLSLAEETEETPQAIGSRLGLGLLQTMP